MITCRPLNLIQLLFVIHLPMLGTHNQMKNSIGGAILIRLLSDLLKEV